MGDIAGISKAGFGANSTGAGPSFSSLLLATQRTPYSQPVSATQLPVSSFNPPLPADLASLLGLIRPILEPGEKGGWGVWRRARARSGA
jgi:hypothetical protein